MVENLRESSSTATAFSREEAAHISRELREVAGRLHRELRDMAARLQRITEVANLVERAAEVAARSIEREPVEAAVREPDIKDFAARLERDLLQDVAAAPSPDTETRGDPDRSQERALRHLERFAERMNRGFP